MILNLKDLPYKYQLTYNEMKEQAGLDDVQMMKQLIKIYHGFINDIFIENPKYRLPKLKVENENKDGENC